MRCLQGRLVDALIKLCPCFGGAILEKGDCADRIGMPGVPFRCPFSFPGGTNGDREGTPADGRRDPARRADRGSAAS